MDIQNLQEQKRKIAEEITTIQNSLSKDNFRRMQELIDESDAISITLKHEQDKAKRLLEQSNLGRRFTGRTFENFDRSRNPKAYDTALNYAKEFPKNDGNGLLLIGTPGTGKTHIAAAITNYIIDKGIAVKFGGFVDILESIKKGFDSATDNDIVGNLVKVPLLVIDDVGKERNSEWSNSILYRVINSRYEDYKPVIITSNHGIKDLERTIGEATVSRIIEMCQGIKMDGADYRKEKLI